MHYRIKGREALDPVYAEALETEKRASDEDQLNALYVALTRAVESLMVITKTKNSWFDPLELVASERGIMSINIQKAEPALSLKGLNFKALQFGAQEETLKSPKEATHDYAAVQFGIALHYTLEMMGEFTPESLRIALESTRNRYGAMLHADAMEEIAKRIECLIHDETFRHLIRGVWYKEQMIRHKGNLGVIDLLVQHEKGWVVIDYKSGREEEEKHREQVNRYCEAIHSSTAQEIEGYLCYLLEDRIEWIKCL
jgi:exodeoxyribonuclease V beta subunit